jgi:hypothetical protein
MTTMTESTAHLPPERWRRALGRAVDTRGYTVDEWRLAALAEHRVALVAAVQQLLEALRLQQTQAELLERDTLNEDWSPWLAERVNADAQLMGEADPVGVAYGLRWCEIVLERQFTVLELFENPPESVVQWTRDLPADEPT